MRSTLPILLGFALTHCSPPPVQNDVVTTDAVTDRMRPDSGTEDDVTTPRSRDFTLLARGMMAHQGRALGVWLIDATGFAVIGFGGVSAIEGDLELRMPDLVPEGDYNADVFVDSNGNGAFDAGEPSWRLPVSPNGSATVSVMGSDAMTNIATPARVPRRDFSMTLSGFSAEEMGRRLELRVIDQGTRATVGAYTVPSVGSGSVMVRLPGIVEDGSGYDVDFWSDVDGNGNYSGPTADHGWRQTVSATGSGVSATWTRMEPRAEDLGWR